MADDSWYPGKNVWEWGKKTAKDHPRITGAVALGGTVAVVLGTGGLATIPGMIVAATAATAGASLGGSAAQDAKDKAEKEEAKK